MKKKCLTFALVLVMCLGLAVPALASGNGLTSNLSELPIYEAAGDTYTLGSTGNDVSVLVIGRVTCGLTLSKLRSVQGLFTQLELQNGGLYLLDLNSSQAAVAEYASANASGVHVAWSGGDNAYNDLFWSVMDEYYGYATSASLPALCVVDGDGQVVYSIPGAAYDAEAFSQVLAACAGGPEAEPQTPAAIAYASTQTITINGRPVEFQAYALKDAAGNDTNYVKLRDVAYALNGTSAQFEVDWDQATGSITVTSGQTYQTNGTEMNTPYSGDRSYQISNSPLYIDGRQAQLEAIVLTDDAGKGYTYFKLRDLGSALGFTVDWSRERGIYIETPAARPVLANGQPITEENVQAILYSLKEQYPEGMHWTNDDYYYSDATPYWNYYGCAAFAMICTDAVFGLFPISGTHSNFDAVRPGDILRINNDTHSVVVLEVRENSVIVTEGNFNSSIHWGREISRASLEQGNFEVRTRYPAGT